MVVHVGVAGPAARLCIVHQSGAAVYRDRMGLTATEVALPELIGWRGRYVTESVPSASAFSGRRSGCNVLTRGAGLF